MHAQEIHRSQSAGRRGRRRAARWPVSAQRRPPGEHGGAHTHDEPALSGDKGETNDHFEEPDGIPFLTFAPDSGGNRPGGQQRRSRQQPEPEQELASLREGRCGSARKRCKHLMLRPLSSPRISFNPVWICVFRASAEPDCTNPAKPS